MAVSTIQTHTGTPQTPTAPAYVTIEFNKSKTYPNGQKLLQVHMHFTSDVSAGQEILGIPNTLRTTNAFLAIPVINTNSGEIYSALMNGEHFNIKKAAPAGWYGICVMYE